VSGESFSSRASATRAALRELDTMAPGLGRLEVDEPMPKRRKLANERWDPVQP